MNDDRSGTPIISAAADSAPLESKQPKKRGGDRSASHKPDCACPACKSRRRKAQALLDPTGSAAPPAKETEVIHVATDLRSSKGRVGQWLALKLLDPEITVTEAAKQIGIAKGYLYSCIKKATEEGWLKHEDAMDALEYDIIPQTIRNLQYHLKKKDKQVTIETAKGTLFKAYAESKGLHEGSQTILAIKIEPASNDSDIKIVTGQIVGRPKEIE